VRRKADPAKALVQEWVRKWRDERGVSSEVSYKQINGALTFPLHSPLAWEAGVGGLSMSRTGEPGLLRATC